MSDLLLDMEAYFVSKGIVASVFRDMIPDTPDTVTALYEYAGLSGLPQIASVNRSVQIVTRDLSATAAKLKSRELYNSLVTEDGILYLTSNRWSMIHLRQTPFKLKVDDRERVYYVFNVGITTYND